MLNNDSNITVVYKTYENDLKWLYYSLLSLKKFVKGINEIIIYCHDKCYDELHKLINQINIECSIISVAYDYHGYIKQMVVKSECYKDIKTDYIVILDSDLLFQEDLNLKDLIEPSGKIKWYYNNNISEVAEERVWKIAYESMTKTKQDFYYMANNFPFVFTKKSMEEASIKFRQIHGIDYNNYCLNRCINYNIQISDSIRERFCDLAQIFEEFEWLGYYCHNFSDEYIFIPQEFRNLSTRPKIMQFWSHGGLTSDIKNQIENILDIK
uniref:Nucleotide-diphospho-sugar transferase domain-containing protein n=1 Tax=viral metagenome TaxID=1070528 RepID=A0A6C0KPB1_9ZZZZ